MKVLVNLLSAVLLLLSIQTANAYTEEQAKTSAVVATKTENMSVRDISKLANPIAMLAMTQRAIVASAISAAALAGCHGDEETLQTPSGTVVANVSVAMVELLRTNAPVTKVNIDRAMFIVALATVVKDDDPCLDNVFHLERYFKSLDSGNKPAQPKSPGDVQIVPR